MHFNTCFIGTGGISQIPRTTENTGIEKGGLFCSHLYRICVLSFDQKPANQTVLLLTLPKMKAAFIFLTILLGLVSAIPDCPDGQHRCSNGECHDCCGDEHCQFGGASCGCTICRDYHCQPKCNPVAGWLCCNVDGHADCKKCCDDSDCPIGAECT